MTRTCTLCSALMTTAALIVTAAGGANSLPSPTALSAATASPTIQGGSGAAEDPATETDPDPAAELTGDIVFSVPSGTFQGSTTVSLSTPVAGAQIRYTTDGTVPGAGSPAYDGTALRFTATTQLRAQAFVDGEAAGAPGTALYVARTFDAGHDIPVLVLDAYGAGKPDREDRDVAVMEFQPTADGKTLSARPTIATRAGFRLRGQSSAMMYDKVPYRLDLRGNDDKDAKYPLLGMPADGDWALRSPFADKAMVRDALAYSLGRDIGLEAPRGAFAEVYVNLDDGAVDAADYAGVYFVSELIEVSKDRLNLSKLKDTDLASPEIEGGYVVRFEWMAAEEPILECTGASATCWNYLELHAPSSPQPEQEAWITQHLQSFHNLMHTAGYTDPETGYPAWIDVDSFVNKVIIQELSREMDSYVRSTYFHKDRGGKIVAGPLWDYDLSFGVGGSFQNTNVQGWAYQQTRSPVATDWFTRLMADPAFVNRIRSRWQELRRGTLSDAALDTRIAELTAPLANAADRNFQRWPNLTSAQIGFFTTPTAGTWTGQVDVMRTWAHNRAAWLDTQWGSAS